MTTATLNSKIFFEVVNIANKYGVHVGQNVQTGQITAENFQDAGRLVHFKNEVEDYLNSLYLKRLCLTTSYNPYCVRIRWC